MKKIRTYFFTFSMTPLLMYTCIFITGILTRSALTSIHSIAIIIIIATWYLLLFSIISYDKKNLIKKLLLSVIAFSTGFMSYHMQLCYYNHTLSALRHYQSAYVQGKVKCYTKNLITKQHSLIVDVHAIKASNVAFWVPIRCTMLLYIHDVLPLYCDDMVQISNFCPKQHAITSFGLYLLKEGIHATAFIQKDSITILNRPTYSIQRMLSLHKEKLLTQLQQKFSPHTYLLFSILFLGNKDLEKKELNATTNQFKQWGIVHFLARSGLHLVIFVALWNYILNFIIPWFVARNIILIVFIFIYTLFSWPSISFVRALATFVAYKIGLLNYKATHAIHILLAISNIILLYNPVQLFFLDFQLSFLMTFALAWFHSIYQLKKSQQTNH